jgi:hypothetical protein
VVSEQMEESLRREIESYVEGRLTSIKHEVAQLQTQLNETLKRILEGEGEDHWDGSLAASVAEHLRAAHERGIEMAASESARTQASSDMAIVKAAIEELEAQNSQADALKSLVNRASSFAPRVVFFVIKGEQVRGWRARGLQGSIGDDAVQQITFPLSADTMVSDVVKSRATWSGTPNSHSEDELLLGRLGEQAPQRIVAVPLVVRGRTVAVLYADSAGLDSDAINLEALETLVRVSGMAVSLLSIAPAPAPAKAAPEYQEQPAVTPEATSSYAPTREYEEPAAEAGAADEAVEELPMAEPIPTPVEAIAVSEPEVSETPATSESAMAESAEVVSEPEPVVAEPVASFTMPEPVPSFTTPEPVPSFATPEPVASFATPEPVAAESAPAPAGTRRRYGTYDSALPVEVNDEEERRQHQDARRFARLLVSEIKLYNEPKVVEGRAQGNLYERLREYIDRSREMYDKRVKSNVSAQYDYFHNELVSTLAEGDASKLGEAYPGTTVTA